MTSINAPVAGTTAPQSQIDTIRAHLYSGATVTTWDAYRLYRITSLAQRIHELRKSGLVIQSKMVTHNDKRFSTYWLNEQTLLDDPTYGSGTISLGSEVSSHAKV